MTQAGLQDELERIRELIHVTRFEAADAVPESRGGQSKWVAAGLKAMHRPCKRIISFAQFASQDAAGNAIGGLSVGEPHEMMYEMTELVCGILPKEKPRYLMGVGTPANILESIALGIDMFDCVMPTRNGRNGMLFTSNGIINLKNKKWENDFSPLDPDGQSFVDGHYTRAYLRHLFASWEMLGSIIASIHNLNFYLWLVGEARKHILEGDFASWKNVMVDKVSRRL